MQGHNHKVKTKAVFFFARRNQKGETFLPRECKKDQQAKKISGRGKFFRYQFSSSNCDNHSSIITVFQL